jgi:hypothetical protein
MAVDVVPPNHRTPEKVWLFDYGVLRHVDPFVVNADTVTPSNGLPICVGYYVPVRIGAALSNFTFQAFEPWLQRRTAVTAIIECWRH